MLIILLFYDPIPGLCLQKTKQPNRDLSVCQISGNVQSFDSDGHFSFRHLKPGEINWDHLKSLHCTELLIWSNVPTSFLGLALRERKEKHGNKTNPARVWIQVGLKMNADTEHIKESLLFTQELAKSILSRSHFKALMESKSHVRCVQLLLAAGKDQVQWPDSQSCLPVLPPFHTKMCKGEKNEQT